ncbi:MAG: 2-dehydropantoate 2-reductase [Rhodospirillales bacterium]|nr:2-dehydropantoate 2-reductase [Rhodospirillales bacterium]
MKIAVMAAGGVGGYFGARLAQAGHEVAFVARGRHLEAIRAQGLRIESPLGDAVIHPCNATDDPAAIGPVDVVLFAVKLWDTEEAAAACRPLLKDGTAVIPFQNGVESIGLLSKALEPEHILGGIAYIATVISAPGVIHHTGTMAKLVMGETDNVRSPRIDAFAEACRGAGFAAEVPADIHRALWEKFVFLVGLSGATAASRQSIGPVRTDEDGRRMFLAAMEETAEVGRAMGINLPADIVESRMAFADSLPPEMKSSLLQDLEAGRQLEAAWLSGGVSRMGRVCGVATPVNDTLYAVVKPYAAGTTA